MTVGGKKRKLSKWIIHVMETKKANAGKAFKDILKMAAKTYKKSPETKHKKIHKKQRTYKKGKKGKKKKKGKKSKRKKRKRQRGGNTDIAATAGAAAGPSTLGGDAGTALAGSGCTLPALDGSGSVTQADLVVCGSLGECGAMKGGKTSKHKCKSPKRKTSKRKRKKGKKS
tara:strand:+ start:5779 stop:6291 length:513 start_codon:yes stop_codon:yes gene_type:complete